MIALQTAAPEFYSDLGDVLRLFYGDVTVADASDRPVPEDAEAVFVHTFETKDGCWLDRWRCGDAETLRRTPVCEGHPIEIKRQRKRAVKSGLYDLLKALTGRRPPWGSLTGIRPFLPGFCKSLPASSQPLQVPGRTLLIL